MYAQIALPLPVRRLFIYQVPSNLEGKIALGCRVLVPLEKRFLPGYVVELASETKIKGVRKIIDLLDPHPLFSEKMLKLTQYISQYYFCSWGEVLKAALPAELGAESSLWVQKKQFDQNRIEDLSSKQNEILNLLEKKPQMKIGWIKRKLGHKGIELNLYHLKEKEIIEFFHKPPQPRRGIEYEKIIRIKDPVSNRDELEKLKLKATKQWECLQTLLENQGEFSWDKLKKIFKSPSRMVKVLENKGFVETIQKQRIRDVVEPIRPLAHLDYDLSSGQLKILSQIRKAIEEKSHRVFLLHGLNPRDRLRIYMETIKEGLKNQKGACILVPEIFLISRLELDLRSYFGDTIGCFHSRLSPFQRYATWKRIKDGDLPFVVGTRSAVFAPLNDLGLIIVDEEHDSSYKQEDSAPRYHARDVAVKRGEMENAVIILGSATPSLESFHNARKGKYVLCRLEEREKKKPLTRVEIVDMNQEKKEGNFSPFSKRLSYLIEDRLSRKEKIVLFLNRRGFSRLVKCQDCGFVYRCPNCNISLAFHQTDFSLRCHFCNFRTKVGATCPECGGHSFSYAGLGTQRINEEIKRKFPKASILRMDLDTAFGKDSHHRILERFKNKDFNLLLGTQMIIKEWEFPDVSLVGVISADFSLDFPDFRSKEKTFQLLTHVLSLSKEKGEVVIQTYHPEDLSIKSASQGDSLKFYELEMSNRKELNYPPFSNLILIRFSGEDKKTVSRFSKRFALKLKKTLESKEDVNILGPAPAPLFRIRRRYRYQILIKTRKVDEAIESIGSIGRMKSLKKSPSVRITINVDPVEMM